MNGESSYTIATVNYTRPSVFAQPPGVSVKVWGEHGDQIQYWHQGSGHRRVDFWFDIRWSFFEKNDSGLHSITSVVTRVTFTAHDQRLKVAKRDVSVNLGGLSVNLGR